MNAEGMVAKYLEIRNYMKAESDAHAERMKPYQDALKTLANGIALFAQQNNLAAVKTDSGTAFPVEQTRVTCEDRDAFHDFVFANNARQFLTAHIAKEAVKEYMDQHGGYLPPGVALDRFTEWQVRKS